MRKKGIWVIVSVVVVLGLLMGGFGCAAPVPTPTPTHSPPCSLPDRSVVHSCSNCGGNFGHDPSWRCSGQAGRWLPQQPSLWRQ